MSATVSVSKHRGQLGLVAPFKRYDVCLELRTPPQDALRLLIAHCLQAEADSVHDMHVTLEQDRHSVATSVAQLTPEYVTYRSTVVLPG